jgi:hypothetical protein
MDKEELIDRICQVSGFLVGFGEVAEIAARKLRELMNDIDMRGLAAAEPERDDG